MTAGVAVATGMGGKVMVMRATMVVVAVHALIVWAVGAEVVAAEMRRWWRGGGGMGACNLRGRGGWHNSQCCHHRTGIDLGGPGPRREVVEDGREAGEGVRRARRLVHVVHQGRKLV